MLKTITDFAKERNVDRDTVNAYMNNHSEIKDFTKLVGKNRVIDTETEAYKLLEKKYPLPQPIIIQEDVETIKELSETRRELANEKQKNNELQEELSKARQIVAQIDSVKALIELRENELSETKKSLTVAQESLHRVELELANAKNDNERIKSEAEVLKKQSDEAIKELEQSLELEKNKKWYQKLFGK